MSNWSNILIAITVGLSGACLLFGDLAIIFYDKMEKRRLEKKIRKEK
jgi:hypothetical protein